MNEQGELRKYLTQLIGTYGLDAFFQSFSNLAWKQSQAGLPNAGQWRRIFISLQDVLIACKQHVPSSSQAASPKTEEPLPLADLFNSNLLEPLTHLTHGFDLPDPGSIAPGSIEEMTYIELDEVDQVSDLIDKLQELLDSGIPLSRLDRANIVRKLDYLSSQLESNS